MSQKGYKKQFINKLDIDPYLGTLNLKLSERSVNVMKQIKRRRGKMIKGFKSGNRTFGDVACYDAELSGIKCALILPKKSIHTDIAEIISSERLRTRLKLKEGSKVKVLVKP